MQAQLRNLVSGHTSGYHYGTIKALVKRGLAEVYHNGHGLEYRATERGISLVKSWGEQEVRG